MNISTPTQRTMYNYIVSVCIMNSLSCFINVSLVLCLIAQ